MNKQQDLFTDLPRGEQLAALRKLKLQTHTCKSGKVSGAVQKSVLKVIDDHQGDRACFASQDTIAEETGYGVSTIRRAIAALISQDLITKERPNHWSPNHHRINWTELTRLATGSSERSTAHHELSTVHTSTSDRSQEHVGEFAQASPLVHHEPRIAPGNANLNAPTNRHEENEWAAVMKDLFSWGLKSAMSSIGIARQRGLSIDHVRELWLESGGDREPERWEPGQLAYWLTGIKPPPFDEDEAIRRPKPSGFANQSGLMVNGGDCRNG
jgi:DNA-binding MarR family transcriptional regulator